MCREPSQRLPHGRFEGHHFLLISCVLAIAAAQAKYCVIIDAGSTGSRIHVYSIQPSVPLPDVRQLSKVFKNHAALAAFSAQPQLAGNSLVPLINHAHSQVPDKHKKDTEIHLLATAGLRLLRGALVESILDSCRQILTSSGFKFQDSWAAVLPGTTEGMYGFIAANYASGALQRSIGARRESNAAADDFLGVLELGGASLQVTFRVEEAGPRVADSRRLSIGGLELDIFTRSFLGFGQDAAQQLALRLASSQSAVAVDLSTEQVVKEAAGVAGTNPTGRVLDPCLPRGFQGDLGGVPVSGGGYFGLCRQLAAGIVLSNCSSLHCGLAGLLLPPLTGKFLGIENLQYTAGFLGLPQRATIRQFLEAAQTACSASWSDMLEQYREFEPSHLLNYCFGAAYAVALLHDGLGLGLDDTTLLFTDTINDPQGQPILLDWTLGAVVLAAEGGNGIGEFDRTFPLMEGGPPKTPPAKHDRDEPEASGTELLLLGIIVFVAAAFCLNTGRESANSWKRKRRRSAVKKRSDAPKPDAEAEEESTDSEILALFGGVNSQAVGRRTFTSRTDLEQGDTS